MADINKELSEYLISNKNEKQYKITAIPMPKTNFGKWFGRSADEPQEQSMWFKDMQMTRTTRLVCFFVCCSMGLLCICLAILYIPLLLLKARKFALLYSLGSIFFLLSFCFLWGPMSYIKSLFTAEKWYFSVLYFATLAGTLYSALHLQSTPLTIFCAVLQMIAILSFMISHLPGGASLMFFTRIFKSSIKTSLPV